MKRGFTLIELSIVLVILGLLVGGVLAGQSLIRAADQRKTLNQYKSYQLAAATFLVKYNALPGDISPSRASAYGMPARVSTGAYNDGNENGVMEGGTEHYSHYSPSAENTLFWVDLSAAGLIEGSFRTADGSAYQFAANEVPLFFPRSALPLTSYWMAASENRKNKFFLGNVVYAQSCNTSTRTCYSLHDPFNITPSDALYLDTKVDDGKPLTGQVTARASRTGSHNNSFWALAGPHSAGDSTVCVTNDAGNPYNQTFPENGNCLLQFPMTQ